MDYQLIKIIHQLNPWLEDVTQTIIDSDNFLMRVQFKPLLDPIWDKKWLVLTGPRQAGKTTLGRYLCQTLINEGRFQQLLYLNCDYLAIRQWLKSPLFVDEALQQLSLDKPIFFIDEAQRLDNPGLLLKAVADLNKPIKLIASGSSQLELKSRVQEYLTGRQFECLVLPLSEEEAQQASANWQERVVYGHYPEVVTTSQKAMLIRQIFQAYIDKDIIEILKVGQPDVLQKLIMLIAHSTGQIIQYQQLAADCQVDHKTIKRYLNILEKTYVIYRVTPFVGNKRTELTRNPVYYFLDNGFRNQALSYFAPLSTRQDAGLLVESFVFQCIYKLKAQHFLDFDIHFWRTNAGAEVDFVLNKGLDQLLPIESKYRHFKQPTVSRALRSFIQAYQPPRALIINKNLLDSVNVEGCQVEFIPLEAVERWQNFVSEFAQ